MMHAIYISTVTIRVAYNTCCYIIDITCIIYTVNLPNAIIELDYIIHIADGVV